MPKYSSQYYKNYAAKPENKVKLRAREACIAAINAGRLVRQPCEACGTAGKSDAHHDDYSKPLMVRWLCKPCHAAVHRGEKRASYHRKHTDQSNPKDRLVRCARGHALTGSNLIVAMEGSVEKHRCRKCRERARRARYLRDRANGKYSEQRT